MKRWFWNCLIGIDQFGNALFGPLLNLLLQPSAAYFGDPELMSLATADYAALIRRHLFDAADFQPYVDRILRERRQAWIG